ncbi:hypothetical protein [Curtobacterium sp. MCBA15_001]|uniref:hypothetical protein n=1 Tax=Curtobacterium sp. MCBA15_001 TaxID=1898731 RepID=UPI0009F29B5C|nr:hypothetical protein [Curtobacterium sp. MCBA15_001]
MTTPVPAAGTTARPGVGALAVVGAAVLWGTTGTATHFAPGVSAIVFGAVTFGVGGLVLAATHGRATVRAVLEPGARRWVWLGAASLVVYAVAFYAGLAGSTPGWPARASRSGRRSRSGPRRCSRGSSSGWSTDVRSGCGGSRRRS